MIGKILHINVNPNGGVPKLQVDKASIQKLGLHNDKQNSKHHGGVDRAVLLWSIEEISKLQKEGTSITPGSAGENLTVEGLEWDQLKKGDIIRVGYSILQLTFIAKPCSTIGKSFKKITTRWCAKVLQGGDVTVGDSIKVGP
tara:strand:- start:430 stop:855 length:426 start_codon:yes stop_codon:yes gene_type:complete